MLYTEDVLECVDVKHGLGQQLSELGVLAFEFAQARSLNDLQAAVLGASLVEGRLAEAFIAVQLGHRLAGSSAVQKANDLLLTVLADSHVRHSSKERTSFGHIGTA
ncbi:hypothetical protein [Acidovorax sp. NCPPB 4044]|uniref:hypothetical protein n=1 Tax=Acidovorax sp. NCPPB 4044 TaxID=2940490 RepID=UPI002302067F|nr:hypothetical protein [Acidovorax sp. NCPPB 4044]MDA8521538.1 hypothetical protein [Acidovorax sp. NCPPB 4044]